MIDKASLGYHLNKWLWISVDLLFPPTCGGCGKNDYRWCSECQQTISLVPTPCCEICGIPQKDVGICLPCQQAKPAYNMLRSWLVFEGPIRQATHRVKYRRDLGLGYTLAEYMGHYLTSLNWEIDLVLPVPLGKKRLQERGYNQVGLFARPLATAQNWEYAPHALKRARETTSQVGLSADERKNNVRGAFVADGKKVADKSILLMDDVATTGATLNACAQALLDGGARDVYALTLARALPRHGLKTV